MRFSSDHFEHLIVTPCARVGKRNDLTSDQNDRKLETAEALADYIVSHTQRHTATFFISEWGSLPNTEIGHTGRLRGPKLTAAGYMNRGRDRFLIWESVSFIFNHFFIDTPDGNTQLQPKEKAPNNGAFQG